MGLFGERKCKQTWRNAKWNVSAGIKQLKIAKRKVELKEKTWKCEAEGGGCSRGNFTSRKTRRMRRETASEMASFEASLPWSQDNWKENAAGYVLPLVFYKMPDEGSFWSYLRRKAHNNLHVFKVAAWPLKQSHKWARAYFGSQAIALFRNVWQNLSKFNWVYSKV